MEIQVIPVTPFAQNCSLIWDSSTNKGAFVDPGGDIEKLIEAATNKGVSIEKIILTHGHLDHVGGTVAIAEHYGVPIVGPHIGDKFWLDALMQQSQMFGFPPAQPFAPNEWLNDNDTISVGNLILEVLHCRLSTPSSRPTTRHQARRLLPRPRRLPVVTGCPGLQKQTAAT